VRQYDRDCASVERRIIRHIAEGDIAQQSLGSSGSGRSIKSDDEIGALAGDRRSWKETDLVELGLGGSRIEKIAVAGDIAFDLLGIDIGVAAHDHLLSEGRQYPKQHDYYDRGHPERREPKGSPIKHRPPPL